MQFRFRLYKRKKRLMIKLRRRRTINKTSYEFIIIWVNMQNG